MLRMWLLVAFCVGTMCVHIAQGNVTVATATPEKRCILGLDAGECSLLARLMAALHSSEGNTTGEKEAEQPEEINNQTTRAGKQEKMGIPVKNVVVSRKMDEHPQNTIHYARTADDHVTNQTKLREKKQFGIPNRNKPRWCYTREHVATSTPGEIKSPRYGRRNYPSNMICSWPISAPAGQKIELYFLDFNLESPEQEGNTTVCYDYVSVANDVGDVIFLNCGTNAPRRAIVSDSNMLTLTFRSDYSYNFRGFHAIYHLYTPSWAEPEQSPASITPSSIPLDDLPCGQTKHMKKIMGGEQSQEHQWPWIAHIFVTVPLPPRESFLCGGTLIHPQWVLSAAHCFEDYDNKEFITEGQYIEVYFGEHDVSSTTRRSQVEKVIIHPDRKDFGVAYNDIALVKLVEPETLTNEVALACLPSHNDFDVFHSCVVAGWGVTHHTNSTTQDVLLHVDLDVITNSDCIQEPGMEDIIDTQLCAMKTDQQMSACQGDSGGPLSCLDGTYYVTGVVSFGFPCGMFSLASPSIFTRVYSYMDWIHDTIGQG